MRAVFLINKTIGPFELVRAETGGDFIYIRRLRYQLSAPYVDFFNRKCGLCSRFF